MTNVFTIRNRLEWTSYVLKAAEHDFYHTWHYHSLDTSGSPLLFVYEETGDFIAIPFLQRDIPGTTYRDLTCVYGYTGPFANKKMEQVPDSLIEGFKNAFLEFLHNENYVSVFSRMHPFYKQHLVLEKFGGVHDNGLTVVLDMTRDISEQRSIYRKSTSETIKQSRRKGFRLKEGKGPEDIATFVSIYIENMRRIHANDYYLFSKDYITSLINTDEYDARILLVYDGEKAICASVITITQGIIQAYLIGTRESYLQYSPAKFMVDEVTLLGRSIGASYFNMGGGLAFKQDGLFEWKKAFTNLVLPYKSWRFVANPGIYQQLLDAKGIDKNKEIDFFPLYRYV